LLCEARLKERAANTVMSRLTDKPTPAGKIALWYRLAPFIAP
jgi:hypothetical protein